MESQRDTQKDLVVGQQGLKAKRTEKLVTAIFMVSDLIDKVEPLRTELRSSSLRLLSDTNLGSISEVMSLINIATSIGLISDMNGGILIKELVSMKDSIPTIQSLNFSSEVLLPETPVFSRTNQGHHQGQDKRQSHHNSILPAPYRSVGSGVGSVKPSPIKTVFKNPVPNESKNDRRETIIKLIKEKREVTIKDISSNISGCSEKTIQRELVSLLKDKVIEKTGEKRWSKYFLARNS